VLQPASGVARALARSTIRRSTGCTGRDDHGAPWPNSQGKRKKSRYWQHRLHKVLKALPGKSGKHQANKGAQSLQSWCSSWCRHYKGCARASVWAKLVGVAYADKEDLQSRSVLKLKLLRAKERVPPWVGAGGHRWDQGEELFELPGGLKVSANGGPHCLTGKRVLCVGRLAYEGESRGRRQVCVFHSVRLSATPTPGCPGGFWASGAHGECPTSRRCRPAVIRSAHPRSCKRRCGR